ncbi:MAG TPA: PRTRC system protein E [Acidobacteriaceae bacterium]
MFKELAPYLRQRAVLLTVTRLEEDQIRVNVIPQKLKDGENAALTTPLSVTGTAEELDRELPSTIVNFVSAHLQLKNSLDRAKEEMDAAAKAAQAEARSKAKAPARKDPPKPNAVTPVATAKPAETPKPEPAKSASLFDEPLPEAITPAVETDEEEDILAEIEDEQPADEELDEVA